MTTMKLYPFFLTGLLATVLLASGCGRDPVATAIRAIHNGDLKKAESVLIQAVDNDPADASAVMNLAIVRYQNGQISEAMTGFAKAADLVPDDPRPIEFIAAILMDNGAWSEAADLLADALKRAPDSPSVMTAIAVVEANTGKAQVARTRLLSVLNRDPSYAPALFNIAVIERDWIKDPGRGRRYFQRYIAATRNDPHLAIAKAALAERSASRKPSIPATPSHTAR